MAVKRASLRRREASRDMKCKTSSAPRSTLFLATHASLAASKAVACRERGRLLRPSGCADAHTAAMRQYAPRFLSFPTSRWTG